MKTREWRDNSRGRTAQNVRESGGSPPSFLAPGPTSARWQHHAPADRLRLFCFCLVTSAFCLCAQAQTDYSNKWSKVSGGGGTSTGGVYSATGTVGQPAAGHMSGGEYTVNGGFWSRIAVVQMPGAPPLTIRPSGANSLAICWPYPAAGYVLQVSTNLNTVNWLAATNVPAHVSNEWQVVLIPPTGGSPDESYCQYFRLLRP